MKSWSAAALLTLSTQAFAEPLETAHRLSPSPTLALLSALAESDSRLSAQHRAYDGAVMPAGFPGMPFPPPPPLNLTPPSLTSSPGFGSVPSAPVPASPLPAPTAPRAVEPQPARPYVPGPSYPNGDGNNGLTACQDLRDKAARLESAADNCDADVAAGAPYCRVTPTFTTPSIPRSMSPGEARGHANRYRQIAAQGDEQACRNFGGDGVVPYTTPTQFWIMRGLAAVYDTRANVEVKSALTQFVLGRNITGIDYDQGSYWTQAMSRHYHMDTVRSSVRDEYRSGGGRSSGQLHYSLNNFTLTENILILFRDIMASAFGFNMAYTTGSIRFKWAQVGDVDYYNRRVTVRVTAEDSLRLQSATRIPTSNNHLLPDNYFGQWGPMHNIPLKWQWTETLYY